MADLHLIVLSTCPDRASAEGLARALIDERLAGCVSLLPGVTSLYRWQGQVEAAEEVQLVIKTRSACLAELERRLTALHPYEVPEFIALPVHTGSPAYLNWLDGNLK